MKPLSLIVGFLVGVALTLWLTGSSYDTTWCEAMQYLDAAAENAR